MVIAKEKEMALKLYRDGKKDRAMLVLKKKKFQVRGLPRINASGADHMLHADACF